MRSPLVRERTFLSKMFRAISLYMIVALCSFFGFIMIFGDVSITPTLPNNAGTAEESGMTKLMNAVLSANNISADLSLKVEGGEINFDADIDAKVDMQNFDFDVDVQAELQGKQYNIKAFKDSEVDSFIHFGINENSFKLDLNEVDLGSVDLTSLMSSLSGGDELNELLDMLSKVVGIDLSTIDLNTLLSEFQITENVVDTGYRFTIYFGNLRFTLDADEELKNMTASIRELTMNGHKINLNINSVKIDGQDFVIDVAPQDDELDVTSLLKIIENAKYDDTSYAFSGTAILSYGDHSLSADLAVKLVERGDGVTPYLRLKTNVEGVDIYAYLIENSLYLNVANLNLMLDLSKVDFSELQTYLQNLPDINAEALTAMSVVLPAFENFHIIVEDDNLTVKVVDDIVIEDRVILTDSMLKLTTVTKEENILPESLQFTTTLTIDGVKNDVSVSVTDIIIGKDTDLSDMTMSDGVLSLMTNNGKMLAENFVDCARFIDMASEFAGAKNVSFVVDSIKVGDILKVEESKVKFSLADMSFNADLTLNIGGFKIDASVYGEDILNAKTIYITVGEKTVKFDLTKISKISDILAEFGISVDIDTDNALESIGRELNIDFENLDIFEIISNLTLAESMTTVLPDGATEEEEVVTYILTYNTSADDSISLTLTYNTTAGTYGLAFADRLFNYDISLSLSDIVVNDPNFSLSAPSNSEDITPILNVIDEAKVPGGYALSGNISVTYNHSLITAEIYAKLLRNGTSYLPYISLHTTVNNVEVYAYLIEDTIYLSVGQMFFKVALADLNMDEISSLLSQIPGISMEETTALSITLPAISNLVLSGLETGFKLNYAGDETFADTIIINDNITLTNNSVRLFTKNVNGVLTFNSLQFTTTLAGKDFGGDISLILNNLKLGALSDYSDNIVYSAEEEGKVVALKTSEVNTPVENFVPITSLLDILQNAEIDSVLEEAQIGDYTYAISGDLAVRYSTSTFYGDLIAMLVIKNDEFVPYVSVSTSAMNLDTNIHLIGSDIFVDLHGLRLKFNISEIDDILTFVKEDLSFSDPALDDITNSVTETFSVVLPALSSISAMWAEETLKIDIGDALKYAENSHFENILMRAFNDTLIMSADIVDPNTPALGTDEDGNSLDYSEYLLVDEKGGVLEGDLTKERNFVVFLRNIKLGNACDYQNYLIFSTASASEGTVIETSALDAKFASLTAIRGKSGEMYSLDAFTDYKEILPLAKGIIDYLKNGSYFEEDTTNGITYTRYKLSLTAGLGNMKLTEGTNMLVELAREKKKDEEDKKIISSLFGGVGLKVQGDLNIETSSTAEDGTSSTTNHQASIYYNSNEYEDENTPKSSGLYITYAHDNFINSDTKFRGHIENASMSDLIAMILGIMNVKLDPAMLESWDLTTSFEQSTTDFSFLRELMGLNKEEGDDVVTSVDSTLLSVSNILDMISNITFNNGETDASLVLSLTNGEENGNLTISYAKEVVGDETICSPTSINFKLGDMYANINFDYAESADEEQTDTDSNSTSNNFEFTYDTTANHHNLSSLPEFMDIAVNTLNTKNFNFKGTVTIDIISIITMDMSIDLYANIEDINNPYIFAQIEFETSKLASLVFDGDFDTRMVTFEFKDNNLTFHRYSKTAESGYLKYGWLWTIADWTKVVEDSVDRNTYSSAEIMPNLTQIILDAFGVKESFLGINLPNMIIEIINSIEANPSLEETLVAFSTDENCENMTLTLDGSSLLGDDGAADMNVNLGAKQYSGYYIDDDGTQIEKTYSFIDSMTGLTIDLSSILVSLDLYSNNDVDSYNTTSYQLKSSYEDNSGGIAGGRLIYTNNYYRNQYMNSVIS